MTPNQKTVFGVLLLMCIVYFMVFIPPNSTGARDPMMISLFETDEFAQYPVVIKMLRPLESVDKTILNFVAYRHYYYGSPFYFGSAILLLIVRGLTDGGNTQLNMLLLRQFISVLPMLAALLLVTYMQTRFKSVSISAGLFALLLAVPAVVENNLWWHVESLAFLFVVLTLFFLDRDDLRFGPNFYLAAAATGLATGTKVIGLFFCLAIALYLVLGFYAKRLGFRGLIGRGAGFLGIMAATIVLSNPFLLLPSQFERMLRIMDGQSAAMSVGWILTYAKGPATWVPIIQRLYAGPLFLAVALGALGLGILKGPNPRLHMLIAAWAIPFGVYVLYAIAIKPTHFFLPIVLPLLSSMPVLLEHGSKKAPGKRRTIAWLALGGAATVVVLQVVTFLRTDIGLYRDALEREATSASIVFYRTIEDDFLARIDSEDPLVIVRDVRIYFPDSTGWIVRSFWNIDYEKVETIKPDVLVLWAQRVGDYTQEGALERAVDPAAFQAMYDFYTDVRAESVRGYRRIYQGNEGILLVSDAIYARFFR